MAHNTSHNPDSNMNSNIASNFKCGLEIHQQLATGKLFCRCSGNEFEKPDFEIARKLRSVAGETGEVDLAARMEMTRQRLFIYQGTKSTCCEVELDEEPPGHLNSEALNVVLQVAMILKARILDEIYVMRKTVVDGSNTSGFQRTALVAVDGTLDTSQGMVKIPTICLEEESCRIISAEDGAVRYGLDRLGIPLIEIGTAPEIKSPEHAMEVAEQLGLILRSTGKAVRGIGSIRQDVNVSVPEGARVEIKGAQELKLIPVLIENEIRRQQALVKIAEELRGAGAKEKLEKNFVDVTNIFSSTQSSTQSSVIKSQLAEGVVLAVNLPHFAGFLGRETQPGKRLGTELSDHARVFAEVKGIFHSDELPNYGITAEEVEAVKQALNPRNTQNNASRNALHNTHSHDAFVIVAASASRAKKALEAAVNRAETAVKGTAAEVRKANSDGTTSFLRWMPGSARMYPETDLSPIQPDTAGIEIPELIKDKEKKYAEMGLSAELARTIAKDKADIFEYYCNKFEKIEPVFIAHLMVNAPKDIKKRLGLDASAITYRDFEETLHALASGKISKDACAEIMAARLSGMTMHDAIQKYAMLTGHELEKAVKEIVDTANAGNSPMNAIMGLVMQKLRGKADGKKIAELVQKFAKNDNNYI